MGETYENLLNNVTPSMSDTVRVVTSGGNTRKATMAGLAATLFESNTGVSLDTTSQNLQGAINELKADSVNVSVEGTTLVLS